MSDDEDYLESNLSNEESSSDSESSETGSETSSETSSETTLEELEELEDLDEDELGTYHILDWDNQLKSKMDELSNSLAEKNVTTEEYRREMLRTNYWNIKRSRKYIVSDEDKEIIDMDIHEYQAKRLLRGFNISDPTFSSECASAIAATTPSDSSIAT